MKKVIRLVFYFVVLVAIASVLLFYSAKDVSVVSAGVTSVSELSIDGVTLKGYVDVHNGGFLPAGVKNITYTVELEEMENVIGRGVLEGGIVKPKETGRFPYSIRIEWVPSIQTALDLLLSKHTFAKVEGVVNVASIKVVRVELPFSAKVNLEGYIEQFVVGSPEFIPEGIASDLPGIIEGVVGNMTEGAETAAGYIEDLFP
ncbi:hypothetical protein JW707_04010 [Candidatus Woesearchaeota archaeon]|nr:hypothetical protein [Candidatus Woesearchaeota archaeon]